MENLPELNNDLDESTLAGLADSMSFSNWKMVFDDLIIISVIHIIEVSQPKPN